MHIPDGYLSPATCATLYAASAPFWYTSLQKIKRQVNTQMVPLLSVFAAFSFIVMMFNLPLPGGTTGHAVGVGIAAIVLGPWASILAISIALIIQAIFFGDGGITAIGANCFNMAILGSLASYAIYRGIGGRAPIESPRRVVAAALAGYLAINLSALATAIELGIQPLLYHDSSGAPLYAPYPLHIAIPAMMIGHLTIAGLAEMVVAGGVVAYLQRSEPHLLETSAPQVRGGGWASIKPLWIALAVLMILTPLGILAVGSAWGETGLQRVSVMWKAPFERYAPSVVADARVGYLLSAIAGVIAILGVVTLVAVLSGRRRTSHNPHFIEHTLASLANAAQYAASAEQSAGAVGALQQIDARVKVAGLFGLIVAVATSRQLWVIAAIFAFAVALIALSRVSFRKLAGWIWMPALLLSGLIAVPALFLTSGSTAFALGRLAVTVQGLRSAAFLVSRAETAATLSAVLVLTTPWAWVLKALRVFRFPVVIVAILGMTYRYIFVILQTALDILESRRSRTVGLLDPAQNRQLVASIVGVLLSKSFQLSGDVHLAMQSRGFRGEVHLLQEFRARTSDWWWLAGFTLLAGAAVWWGR